MEFKKFKYLLKIAETRNITRAAHELYVSQPFLSLFLKKTEEEIGVELFNRMTNPLSLTPAGEKYVEMANSILDTYDQFVNDMKAYSNQTVGRINLGIPHSRAAYMLPYILPEFTRLYPGFSVEMLEGKTSVLRDVLLKHLCDCIIIPIESMGAIQTDNDYEAHHIYQEELFLISGKPIGSEDRTDKVNILNENELAKQSYIMLKQGHGIRLAVDQLFEKHSVKAKIVIETTSNETAFRMASSKMGVAIVPEISIFSFQSPSKPYLYRIGKRGTFWDVVMLIHKNNPNRKILMDFLEVAKKQMHDNQDMSKLFGEH